MRSTRLQALLVTQVVNGLTTSFFLSKDTVDLTLPTRVLDMSSVLTPCNPISSGFSTLQAETFATSESLSDIIAKSASIPESASAFFNVSCAHSSMLQPCTFPNSAPAPQPTLPLSFSSTSEEASSSTAFNPPSPILTPPSPSCQSPWAYLPPWLLGVPSPPSYSATLTWSPVHSPSLSSSKMSSSAGQSLTVPAQSSMLSSTASSQTLSSVIVSAPVITIATTSGILAQPTHSPFVAGKSAESEDISGTASISHAPSCNQTPRSSSWLSSSSPCSHAADSTSTTTTMTVETTTARRALSHSSTYSTADSNRSIYTSVLPADPRCPYPFPGIDCSGPSVTTLVTLTKTRQASTLSVTQGGASSATGAASGSTTRYPYPGQKC